MKPLIAALGLALAGGPAAAAVTVSATTYLGFEGYRLSDGRTEAVVVPALMRVVRYAAVGGANWLWVSDARTTPPAEWRNWGGDKTWLAPQLQWPGGLVGREWPPDDTWEAEGVAGMIPGGLRVTGRVSAATGIRITRVYSFTATGAFVITQRAEKMSGGPVVAGLWSVTQVVGATAVFLPVSPASGYRGRFHDFGWGMPAGAVAAAGRRMVAVRPDAAKWFKVGVDAPLSALVTVRGGEAFVQRAPHPTGPSLNYPDGATGYGCPVEVYNADGGGKPAMRYMELELLAPLMTLTGTGSIQEHAVQWSLASVPRGATGSPGVVATVDRLVQGE